MNYIKILNSITKETEKAVRIAIRWQSAKGKTCLQEHWLPKSQLVITDEYIEIPLWLIKEQSNNIDKLDRDKWAKVYSDIESMFISYKWT